MEKSLKESGQRITEVQLGALRTEGGTRSRSYRVGGEQSLPFIGAGDSAQNPPLIALEICDDTTHWSPIVLEHVGDVAEDTAEWAKAAETTYGADLVRLYLTSTKNRGYDNFDAIRPLIEEVLQSTGSPLVIEGSNEPSLDSEVFRLCGETGEGEKLLLGTAEADRYRSVAAAALAYGHSVIAQTPIDINLAKQLNILLRETGVGNDRIIIDSYTGALGYGFEYSYSVMERIRTVGLNGDPDLAMPMISSPIDSLNVKEVREADLAAMDEFAVKWEFYAALSSLVAGVDIVCVRHPETVGLLKKALEALRTDLSQEESV